MNRLKRFSAGLAGGAFVGLAAGLAIHSIEQHNWITQADIDRCAKKLGPVAIKHANLPDACGPLNGVLQGDGNGYTLPPRGKLNHEVDVYQTANHRTDNGLEIVVLVGSTAGGIAIAGATTRLQTPLYVANSFEVAETASLADLMPASNEDRR